MTLTVTAPDICRLAESDAATLRQIWQETKGTAPPKTFTARLMRLSLAWRNSPVAAILVLHVKAIEFREQGQHRETSGRRSRAAGSQCDHKPFGG